MTDNKVSFVHLDCEPRSPYHYTECGLSNIWLVSGYEEEDGECYVSVRDADALHQQISMSLIRQKTDLRGEQVRFLRKEMNLTQSELAALVNVSAQTVARWEKNQTDVPGPVNVLLRLIALNHFDGKVNVMQVAKELQKLDETLDDRMTLRFDQHDGWRNDAALAA